MTSDTCQARSNHRPPWGRFFVDSWVQSLQYALYMAQAIDQEEFKMPYSLDQLLALIQQLLRAVQNGGAGEVSRRFNLAAHMSAVL